MTGAEIVSKVKTLKLPQDSYVIFGSCPLAAVGIREANDIDMLVSAKVYEDLIKAGWQQIRKGPDDTPLTYDVFEAHDNWDFSPYSPTLETLLSSAVKIDGVAFASLQEVRKWKVASGTPKHLADVKLIDEYLESQE